MASRESNEAEDAVAEASVEASASPATVKVDGDLIAVAQGEDRVIPLDRLFLSAQNARKVRNPETIPALADMILGQGGLLNPLCVVPEKFPRIRGEAFGVVAGGRRLAALQLLAQHHRMAADAPIACKVFGAERALGVSLTENVSQERMHGADQLVAFGRLAQEGKSVGQIAAAFGVSALTVERRLKLANLAPMFIELYRQDKIEQEQLQALALADSHEQQLAVWNALPPYQRSAYMIRQTLVNDEIEAGSRIAKFVGIDAYVAAGGPVRRDLFAGPDEGWLQDGALLHRLAAERLEEEAAAERAAGWAWVEVQIEKDVSAMPRMDRERPKARRMTREEAEGMAQWQALVEEAYQIVCTLDQAYQDSRREDDENDEGEEGEESGGGEGEEETRAQVERLEAAEQEARNLREVLSLLHVALTTWSPRQLATCGVILSLDASGRIEATRGLMRAQEKKALVAELKKAGKPVPAHLQESAGMTSARGKAKPERGPISERLMLDLTAHRTAAMQAALTAHKHVALAMVVHRMAEPIFTASSVSYRSSTSPLKLSAALTCHTPLAARATGYAESPAASVLEQAEAFWGDRVPGEGSREGGSGGEASTLGWFFQQDDSTLLELLAFCAASALDAMRVRDRAERDDADRLAEALDLDLADWWAPTPAKYLESVSKAQLVEAVTEACGAEVARPIAGMKKKEAVAYCAAKLEGTRWLPAPLRRKAVEAVASARQVERDSADDAPDATDDGETEANEERAAIED